MTKDQEEAKRRVEVMLAFANGEEIEWARARSKSEWGLAPTPPAWDWVLFDYRIKPKPQRPRRCVVGYTPKVIGDPWRMAFPPNGEHHISEGLEPVQLIELTPEVIAALEKAGIEYDK